jgi:hypothetical protein
MRPAVLRRAVADHLAAELGAAGWSEATQAYDAFPAPEGARHLLYAVGVLRSDPQARDRQRITTGIMMTTTLGVRFSATIRANAAVEDYDRALNAEADLVEALGSFKSTEAAPLRIVSIPTRLVSDGILFAGEVTVSTSHRYPLS